MVKVEYYRYSDSNKVISKELWYDVSNQVFYDKYDSNFGVGIIRSGVAVLRR